MSLIDYNKIAIEFSSFDLMLKPRDIQSPFKGQLLDYFPKSIFWDVNPELISLDLDRDFIIERVLSRAMEQDSYVDILEQLYSKSAVKRIAKNSQEIRGNEVIQFLSDRYGLNVSSFPGYINLAKYA